MPDPDPIDELVDDGLFAWMATWQAQTLAARAVERVMRERAGLSLTWGEVLSTLGAADGGRMTMNELARRVFVSRSAISQVVTQLAGRGLVERQGDPANLRITYAALTPRGREILTSSTTAFLAAVREHFGRHLDEAEARTVTAVMNRVIDALGGTPEPADRADTVATLRRVVGEQPGS